MPANQQVAEAYIASARQNLREAHEKIIHCLAQLDDEQVNWRPFEQQNSIANVIIHLCGNVRQWLISGIGGTPDVRNRAAEFADRGLHTRAELLEKLDATLSEVDETLARVTPERLLEPI